MFDDCLIVDISGGLRGHITISMYAMLYTPVIDRTLTDDDVSDRIFSFIINDKSNRSFRTRTSVVRAETLAHTREHRLSIGQRASFEMAIIRLRSNRRAFEPPRIVPTTLCLSRPPQSQSQ